MLLHRLQRPVLDFQCLILFTKSSSESLCFISFSIKFHIIGPKYQSELEPLKTVLTCRIAKSDC